MRPEYRNGGHGTQLLKNAIAWARAEGIGELMGEIATPALGTGAAISPPMQREVLEETGWHVTGITPVGIWHFHHLAPRLARCRFPYPDFLNVIYRAKTTRYDAAARIADDYETGSRFIGLETLLAIRLEQPSQLVLARHAAGDS
jgi:8-oxo-dGTP pyrophosphatase MutT (NUDIX family)